MSESLTLAKVAKFIKDGLPEGKSSAALWATAPKGLGLRLRSGGAAAWIFQFRPKGSGRGVPSRTVTLGRADTLSLSKAIDAATALAGQVALARDPAIERREAKLRSRRTLGAALDEFERHLVRRRIVNVKTMMSTLRRGLSPHAGREIEDLSRADFVRRIEKLEADGKPGAAQDLRKHSRSFLEWSVGQGLAKHNTMSGLRRPRSSRAERLDDDARRGRALDDSEIAALWTASGSLGAFGGLVRFGLLTGLRRSELASLRWSDVHADRIVIEAHGTKAGVAHELPVTSAMRAVLASQSRSTKLVFPSARRTSVETKLSGWTQLVAGAVRASGVNFKLHDLRRTTRTLMSRCGVSQESAELAIGHARSGLVALYNKDSAWPARVDAFEKVSAHIAGVIASSANESEGEASNVVTPMRAVVKSA